MKIGSLFSGYGGLDMAVQDVFGGTVAWHCEWEAAPSKILAHHWPDVPNLHDVTQIEWEELVSCKPDLETTQHMYDLYCQGHSLAQVGKMTGVSRQTVFTRFKRRGLDMRDRAEPLPFREYDGRRYTIGTQGYYRATEGDRELMHRAVWMRERGLIPEGWDVHHIDHDKTNNVIENLACMSKADYARLHGGDATDSFSVDILTGGYPRAMSTIFSSRPTERNRR